MPQHGQRYIRVGYWLQLAGVCPRGKRWQDDTGTGNEKGHYSNPVNVLDGKMPVLASG